MWCKKDFILIGLAVAINICIHQRSVAQDTAARRINSSNAMEVSASADTSTALRPDTYIAFDSKNNSYSFEFSSKSNYGKLFINENGSVRKVNLLESIQQLYSKTPVPNDTILHALGSITIDNRDRIFLVFYFYYPFDSGRYKWKARIPLLLYSGDYAKTFKAYQLPNDPDMVFLEKKSPFESNDYPPLIGYTKNKKQKISPMADLNEFGIFVPKISGSGELSLGQKIVLTGNSPGISNHTGGESFTSTFGNTSYIAFNEIPPKKDGNNLVIIGFDRRDNKILGQKQIPLLMKSKYPYPDAHVTPVIVTCKNGEQHVLAGPQAGDCYDFKRNVSGGASDDFTQAATLAGPRVYVSALADSQDNIYLFYDAYKPKPGFYFQKYEQQTKSWLNEQLLAFPPKDFSSRSKDNFGIYYFKAAIDHNNEIYTSFTFFDTYEKTIYPRYLLKSSDKGSKWRRD